MTNPQIKRKLKALYPQTLPEVSARMLEIESENMAYNKQTNFGQSPNGQEDYIKSILTEWDQLKILRSKLKYS